MRFEMLGFIAMAVVAQEIKVEMKDLPREVQKVVQEQTRNATLIGISKEVEHGRVYYEAEMTVDGKPRDILIDRKGNIVEIEESTALSLISEPARRALERQAGPDRIIRVETVTRGSRVSYEAVIDRAGKKTEIAVNPDGSPARKN